MDDTLRQVEQEEHYLDDVAVATDGTQAEHIAAVQEVLAALAATSLYVNPDKCTFSATEIVFGGFWVGRFGHTLSATSCEAVTNIQPPTSASTLQSFLGFINHFR